LTLFTKSCLRTLLPLFAGLFTCAGVPTHMLARPTALVCCQSAVMSGTTTAPTAAACLFPTLTHATRPVGTLFETAAASK
jgi:hypothetical protein